MTRPLALAAHHPDRLAADQEHAAQVDADQPVEVGGAGLQQRLLDQDAGIVDQDVEPAEARQNSVEHRDDLGLVGDVDLGRERLPAAGGHGSATSSIRSWSARSAIATRQPSAASARAMARPMPLAPPVTSARLPASEPLTPSPRRGRH